MFFMISIIYFYVVCLERQRKLHQRNKVRKDHGSVGHVLELA